MISYLGMNIINYPKYKYKKAPKKLFGAFLLKAEAFLLKFVYIIPLLLQNRLPSYYGIHSERPRPLPTSRSISQLSLVVPE